MAFDAHSTSDDPSFALHVTDSSCNGVLLGEVRFGPLDPQPISGWRSHCVGMPQGEFLDAVSGEVFRDVLTISAVFPDDALVGNPRLVSSCGCPRDLKRWPHCGVGYGSGGESVCPF